MKAAIFLEVYERYYFVSIKLLLLWSMDNHNDLEQKKRKKKRRKGYDNEKWQEKEESD